MKKDILHTQTVESTTARSFRAATKVESRPRRMTSRSDSDLLGPTQTQTRPISVEDELWLKQALRSRLIF